MNPKYPLERSLIGKMLKDFFLYEKHKLEDSKQYDIVARFPTSYSFVWMSHCSTASIWFRSSLIPEEAGEWGPSSPKYQSNSSSSIPSESEDDWIGDVSNISRVRAWKGEPFSIRSNDDSSLWIDELTTLRVKMKDRLWFLLNAYPS